MKQARLPIGIYVGSGGGDPKYPLSTALQRTFRYLNLYHSTDVILNTQYTYLVHLFF